VSTSHIVLLGALAGFTIFLGLPIARVRNQPVALKALLAATATGILLFLLWDVITHGIEPVEEALTAAAVDHTGSWQHFAGLAAIFGSCFAAGFMSLVYYDELISRRRRRSFLSVGAASAAELGGVQTGLSPAESLALLIATGIGLHNFSEGLAIGQSAADGKLTLAYVLIIGFGLHNATEGFGIVGPLSGGDERPTWAFLALLGLIGGGPTLVGTLVGQTWVSEPVSIAFLALAAGSILYVVIELLSVCRSFGRRTNVAWGLMLGLTLGFATDFILTAAGV
jgi:ZIP family zinc transporter